MEIRDHILSKQIQIRRSDVPPGWSLEAADLINKLIQRKPINRLGLNGATEVKNHPWFRGYPWDELMNKQVQSPFLPNMKDDNFDAKYTNSEWKDNNDEQMKNNILLLRRNSVQALFNGYYFDGVIQSSS